MRAKLDVTAQFVGDEAFAKLLRSFVWGHFTIDPASIFQQFNVRA